MRNLEEAEEILKRSGSVRQMIGDNWSIPGTATAQNPRGRQIGGIGEAGQAFKAAEMALLDLNFALSGKSVSNAEREAFVRLYMPSSWDSAERQTFKFRKMREFFQEVLRARDNNATDDDIAKMYRDRLRDGSQLRPAPAQPERQFAPAVPTKPGDDLKKRYGLE